MTAWDTFIIIYLQQTQSMRKQSPRDNRAATWLYKTVTSFMKHVLPVMVDWLIWQSFQIKLIYSEPQKL